MKKKDFNKKIEKFEILKINFENINKNLKLMEKFTEKLSAGLEKSLKILDFYISSKKSEKSKSEFIPLN